VSPAPAIRRAAVVLVLIQITLAVAAHEPYVVRTTQMQLSRRIMSEHGRPPGFEENAAFDEEPVIAARVPVVMEDVRRAGHLGGPRVPVTLELDEELLATVKRQTGLDDTAAVIDFALAHVALDADFVAAARRRTWQAIDDDLDLDV